MIKQTNAQVNLPKQVNSLNSENTAKKPSFNVSYRTQEQLDHIESFRHPLLEHHRTRKKSSAFALLKLIAGRHLNGLWQCCKTSQITLGEELYNFEHNKSVGDRQIRRLLTTLKKEGLITYFNPSGKFKEVKIAAPTELGLDVYRYIILNNRSHVRLALLNRTPQKPINSIVLDELPKPQKENVRHYMDPYNIRSHIHTLSDLVQRFDSGYKKIDLSCPILSYDELQNEVLQVKRQIFQDKIACNAPEKQLNTVKINYSCLPYSVFNMLHKNFHGEQADILCELLENTEASEGFKINFIESFKELLGIIAQSKKDVASFGGLAYSTLQKRLIPKN